MGLFLAAENNIHYLTKAFNIFMYFKKVSLWLFSTIFLFILFISLDLSSLVAAKSDSVTKRPPPPRRVPPNKVTPGGGLDITYQSCNQANKSLIALIPIDNPVLTTQAYPSFLFYIPDPPAEISHGEFSIFTANDKRRIYQTSIDFAQTPAIIKINLPANSEYALAREQKYHWYFKVYCQDFLKNNKILDVDGWIQRASLTPAIKSKIEAASPDIWYDTTSMVVEDLIANPQNQTARDRWLKLLQHIDRAWLADVVIPIVIKDKAADSTQ